MGRHRNVGAARTARQVGVAAAVMILLGTTAVGYRMMAGPGCTGTVRLSVGAAPELVPALKAAVGDWTGSDSARVGRQCVSVSVTAADPADVAAAIAASGDKVLSGLGRPSGATAVPDVWIPDSSLWLRRLRALGDLGVPEDAPSIARSPVVLAAPEPVAKALGWPDAKPTWSDLLAKVRSDTTLHLGIVDPTRDAAGLTSLVALTGTGGTGGTGASAPADARAALVAALRALAGGRSLVRDDLMRRFPRGADAAALASGLSLAPLPEHAIINYDASQPPVRVVGLPVQPSPPALDYPYTVLPEISKERASAAAALRTVLAGYAFRDRLSVTGLRSSDGTAGAGFFNQVVPTVDPGAQTQVPEGKAADQVLATWSAITLPSRMLAVLDVSGSMLETVPSVGGATRMAVTIEAARRGLALFDNGWAVGLWTFSTNLDGDRDYRELTPIGPLSAQRDTLNQALVGITPKSNGDTGLYDTVLAAYRAVQSGWDPGRVNSVVLLTDGQNDDANGISLDQLLAELKQTADPKRPVQVILIGIGTNTSEAAMKRITDQTGGGVFVAEDPARIGEIFLQAIALRPANTGR